MHTIALLVGGVVLYQVFTYAYRLLYNIAEAKRSGLPYIVAPWGPFNRTWQVTHKIWIPLLRLLPPQRWWRERLELSVPGESFRARLKWSRKFKNGTFIIVCPDTNILHMGNAEGITYMIKHRDQFPKWVEVYYSLRAFGENVVTTDGAEWRFHRRIMAATFNERNTALVFREAISQTRSMLDHWTNGTGVRKESIRRLDKDTMRVALNIIGYVGFGLRLLWPGQTVSPDTDPKIAKYGSLEAPPGYHRSFADAMSLLLENLLPLLFLPTWALRLIPAQWAKHAVEANDDYIKYTNELLDLKLNEARFGDHAEEGMDLMGQMARSSIQMTEKDAVLTRDEIIGNAFIMKLAGHETTANTLNFTFIYLAMNPSAQRRLQEDVDAMLGDSDPSTWDYDTLINSMMASRLAACMHETMRLLPSVAEVPKMTRKDEPLVFGGREYIVPKNTAINLAVMTASQTEEYWPTRPSKVTPGKSDILDYVPERWFHTKKNEGQGADEDEEDEDFGGFKGPDTSAKLYQPPRGAFIPFSDGPRACLGRRIAQVEVIAAMAVIFKQYSFELAVDEWASDEEVARMDKTEMYEVYGKAKEAALEAIDGCTVRITIKLKPGTEVPVRLVRRGEERFVNWME